jgi:hypothetical protein
MIPDWHDRIRRFPCITRLEVVYSHHISALDLGDDQEECVVDRHFSIISHLEGTQIQEVVVWHGVEALGISPGFQVLAFYPVKKVTFLKISANRWTAKLGFNGEPQPNEPGSKFSKRIYTID